MALPSVAPASTAPLIPAEESRAARAWNIGRGIVVESVAFAVLTVLLLPLLVLAALVDAVRAARTGTPFMAVRLVLMAWWFLLGEVRGWLGLTLAWLLAGGPFDGDSPRRRRHVWYMQRTWMQGHLLGVRSLFGLRFEVEGDELVEPGPILVLIRHANIIDNSMPAAFVSGPHGLFLRYVLKAGAEGAADARHGRALGAHGARAPGLPGARGRDRPGAVPGHAPARRRRGRAHYPEGTRHTPAKLARAQERIRESDPQTADLADRLHHLLPPRLAGVLALLDEGSVADVVVFGHVGLDGFEKIGDIWSGGLVGTTVRVRFWRYPRSDVPDGERERIAWLYGCWQVLDDWIGEQRALEGS